MPCLECGLLSAICGVRYPECGCEISYSMRHMSRGVLLWVEVVLFILQCELWNTHLCVRMKDIGVLYNKLYLIILCVGLGIMLTNYVLSYSVCFPYLYSYRKCSYMSLSLDVYVRVCIYMLLCIHIFIY